MAKQFQMEQANAIPTPQEITKLTQRTSSLQQQFDINFTYNYHVAELNEQGRKRNQFGEQMGRRNSTMGMGTGIELSGYCDSDWGGCIDTRRSTTGYLICVNGGVISWSSKRQPTVALSSAEAEYMAMSAAVQEIVWTIQLLSELGWEQKNEVIH